jgi:diguanylate cyclase (GGDEF)-like protein
LSFRYGGEEFVVLLRKTNDTGAHTIAERLRRAISKLSVGHNGHAIRPTVSIGISTRSCDQKEHINDLFDRADRALYNAKLAGRNCVRDLAEVGI